MKNEIGLDYTGQKSGGPGAASHLSEAVIIEPAAFRYAASGSPVDMVLVAFSNIPPDLPGRTDK